jgi:hypothetical protein
MASNENVRNLELEKEDMMNGHFDGGHGLYGGVLVGAMAELSSLLNKDGRRPAGRSWKRVVLMLVVIAAPVALLLANGNGL